MGLFFRCIGYDITRDTSDAARVGIGGSIFPHEALNIGRRVWVD